MNSEPGMEPNAPRVVWRKPGRRVGEGGYYAPSVACHRDGRVRISAGGRVVTMTVESWVDLGWSVEGASTEEVQP